MLWRSQAALLLTLNAALMLSSCGRSQTDNKDSNKFKKHPCSQIALQEDSWTPENTRNVVACLFAQSPETSLQVQKLEASRFKELAHFLSKAFRDSSKRSELSTLLKELKSEAPLIVNALRDPLVQSYSHKAAIRRALPWLIESLRSAFEDSTQNIPSQNTPLADWMRQFNQLHASPQTLRIFLKNAEKLIDGIQDSSLPTARLLDISVQVLSDLSYKPQIFNAFLKLSSLQECKSADPQQKVSTQSLLHQSIHYFRSDKEHPSHFLNSVQQGFSFWNAVCQNPQGTNQNDVRVGMNWILSNWDILHEFFESEISLKWLDPGTQLLHNSALIYSLEPSATLRIFFGHPFPQKILRNLQKNPQRREHWLSHFSDFTQIFEEETHKSQTLEFSENLIESLERSLRDSQFLQALLLLPPQVILEIWDLAIELDDPQFSGLLRAMESGKAQELIEFVEWILNLQGERLEEARYRGESSKDSKELAQTAPNPPNSKLYQDLKRAQEAMQRCFGIWNTREEVDACLGSLGFIQGPPLVKTFWALPNTSPVLSIAHASEVEYFVWPSTARRFWQPTLRWIQETRFPLNAALDFVAQSEEKFRNLKDHEWNPLLSQAFRSFQREIQRSSGSKELQEFRRHRVSDIDESLFADPALRAFLLDSRFLEGLLHWIDSPKSLASKKSLQQLVSFKFSIQLWTENARLQAVPLNVIEAFDVLFGELQVPIICSNSMIRRLLESFETMRSTQDLRVWMQSKVSQLDLARKLSLLIEKPGYGLHRRFDNAIRILEALLKTPELHLDLLQASRALTLFHGPRARFTNDSAKALLALRQLGALNIVSTVFADEAPWKEKILDPASKMEIPSSVIRSFAALAKHILSQTPVDFLQRSIALQVEQDLWLLRGVVAAALSTLYTDKTLKQVLSDNHQLILGSIGQVHPQVLLPWIRSGIHSSDRFWFQQMLTLKSVILNMEASPHTSWFSWMAAINRETSMKKFINEIVQLPGPQMEQLLYWLESGIPLRLVQWNRLMNTHE